MRRVLDIGAALGQRDRRVGLLMRMFHVLSVAVYAAATWLLLAAACAAAASARWNRLFLRALRFYGPTAIATLGVALMTGAFRLTDFKALLGPEFYARVGEPLASKLAAVFLLVNLTAYVSFGIGLRLLRATDAGHPPSSVQLRSTARRAALSAAACLAFAAVAVHFSARLTGALLAR